MYAMLGVRTCVLYIRENFVLTPIFGVFDGRYQFR